ncbi:choline dehydrogenase [Micromonospora sp. 15K316]|uniref:GMC family oxidoreductase n=1 Tax=Micromonospora sp. 15K316 TaxID=2530376 RepID=UPI001046E3D2|nr:GMC family oxidoreductase N-terminal domain-containing protein [Micromonospora sp. 15K316]TDC37179.1 choline dehydrogenase [Micromonospora sp. 15K316]
MHSFDYVIVGAGSAGSVLAARLSENPQTRVLLVEAGAAEGPELMAVPPAWPALIGSAVDWGFTTVPQNGTDGIVHPYPRGKVFGGSSSINAMAFMRGHRSGYDAWARNGAEGWGHEDLLPFFKRSERAPGRDSGYRGTDGPMVVSPATDAHPLSSAYLDAALEVGHHFSSDLSGKEQEGVAWLDTNIVDGVRQSAADGYLRPVLARPNLTVIPDVVVRRLTLSAGRCTGVEYSVDGQLRSVSADREVILSAGAVGSPHLLMLSGIGPAEHLREFGIDVVAHLPGVGANLQDHPLAGITYAATKPVPPTVNQHSDLVAMVRSRPDLPAPDLQLLFLDIAYHPPGLAGPTNGYTIAFSLMLPHSRGSVRLASGEPTAAPLIDPNFLGDERDLSRMVTGLRMAREVGEARALADWRVQEALPGAKLQDEDELEAYVRQVTGPYFHATGTCRIGTDPMAVVDADLRVHGVDGLRVVDASVMPEIVGANPNATVLAIAERAATLIAR